MANQLQDPNPPHWDRQFIDGSLIANAQDIPRPARNNLALGHNRNVRTLTTGTISSQDICGSLLASQIAPALSNAYIRNVLNILRLAEGLPVNVGNSAAQRIRQAANAHGTPMPATRPKADEARHEPLPVPANVGVQYIVAPAVPGPNFQVVLANPHGPQPKAAPGQQITQVPINRPPGAPTAPSTGAIQQSQVPAMPPAYPSSSAPQPAAPMTNAPVSALSQPPSASLPGPGSRARVPQAQRVQNPTTGVKRSREEDLEDLEDWYLDSKRTCKDRERQYYVYAEPTATVSAYGPYYSLTPHHVQAGWECCE